MGNITNKKILFVITKSNWGGAQAYVYALATNFQREGAIVVVAYGGTGLPGAETGLLAEKLKEAGIQTIFVSSFAREVSFDHELAAFKELREIIKQEKPDILHLNSSKAGGLGALVGRLKNVPHIVYTAHGWAHREPRPFYVKAVRWISSWITIWLCHSIITVSKLDYKTSPVFFSRKKIIVIHNGIDVFPLLNKIEARDNITSYTPVPTDSVWITMVAELHANKGIDLAIRTIAQLVKNFPSICLLIIGEGEERDRLKNLIIELDLSTHIFLLGFIENARESLRASDIFLMPSRKEGLPMALLEAGFAEIPIIATKVGGIPEVIEDHKNGLLIESNDIRALRGALTELLSDSETARAYGKEMHANIIKNFSERKMLEKTCSVYLKPQK